MKLTTFRTEWSEATTPLKSPRRMQRYHHRVPTQPHEFRCEKRWGHHLATDIG